MNRRTFGKVLAGSVAAAAGPEAEGKRPGPTRQTATALRRTGSESWQFVILDSVPPHLTEIAGNVVADMDGDGKTEVIVAGDGALLWYKPWRKKKASLPPATLAWAWRRRTLTATAERRSWRERSTPIRNGLSTGTNPARTCTARGQSTCWTLKWQGIHTTFSSEIWTEMGDGNW